MESFYGKKAMSKAMAQTSITKSADEVWAKIGRFDDVRWYDGVETCTVNGDMRTVTVRGTNMEVDERQTHRDESKRTYTYEIRAFRGDTVFKGPNGTVLDYSRTANHQRSTITVTPQGPLQCLVSYGLELDDGFDELLDRLRNGYQVRIEKVKRELES